MRCRFLQPENCLLKLRNMKQSLMCIFVHLEIPCKRFQAVTIVTDLFGIEVEAKKKRLLIVMNFISLFHLKWCLTFLLEEKKHRVRDAALEKLCFVAWKPKLECFYCTKFFLRFLSGINGCWDVSFHVHHQFWPYDKTKQTRNSHLVFTENQSPTMTQFLLWHILKILLPSN